MRLIAKQLERATPLLVRRLVVRNSVDHERADVLDGPQRAFRDELLLGCARCAG